mgnify:CR=1 FL=1
MVRNTGFWFNLLIVVMALSIIFLLCFNLYILNDMDDIWGMFLDLYDTLPLGGQDI